MNISLNPQSSGSLAFAGGVIKKLREDGGLSQAALCELMGRMNGTGSGTSKFGIGRVQLNPRSMRITANSEFQSA